MVTLGKKVPDFQLKDGNGYEHTLKHYAGKWVVLYFYPKDNTPGCTTEAIQFTALEKDFLKVHAKVFGISKDSCESHKKFTNDHSLKVDLLADPDGVIVEEYGAWGEKNLYGKKSMGIVRITAIIAPDQSLAYVFYKVKADGHAAEVLEKINELKGAA